MSGYKTEYARIFDLRNCIGKQIVGVYQAGLGAGIRFSDQTYFWCEVESSDEDAVIAYEGTNPPDEQIACSLGIIDATERDRFRKEQHDGSAGWRRAEYERLKAEFEPSNSEQDSP